MENLELWNKVRTAPAEALKEIKGGRLKGMSDINPMWRFQTLTENFGMCGVGWKYVITNQRLVNSANDTVCAFVDIDLFVKVGGEWSDAIQGCGGSSFVANESSGLYVNDECFKMALTDAISVACKALGLAADVYWKSGATKYDVPSTAPTRAPAPAPARPAPAPVYAENAPVGTVNADFIPYPAGYKSQYAGLTLPNIPMSQLNLIAHATIPDNTWKTKNEITQKKVRDYIDSIKDTQEDKLPDSYEPNDSPLDDKELDTLERMAGDYR